VMRDVLAGDVPGQAVREEEATPQLSV
jgi:hypothetical protein